MVLIDAPGANPAAPPLLEQLQFRPIGSTLRNYRGATSMAWPAWNWAERRAPPTVGAELIGTAFVQSSPLSR